MLKNLKKVHQYGQVHLARVTRTNELKISWSGFSGNISILGTNSNRK